MRRKKRKWDNASEDDPGAGLINLFDVWIAFAVALLLSIISYENLSKKSKSHAEVSITKQEGTPEMERINEQGKEIEHFRPSEQNLGGDGERLGTAYRLKSGEVIYVPEKTAPAAKE